MHMSNQNEMRREQARRASNKACVLDLLRERGDSGATNVELVEVGGMRAVGARLTELRAEGHRIETIREGGGLFRFVLHTGPRPGQTGYLASLPAVNAERVALVPPAPADSGRLF
jgi:hypothetical protein